MTAFNRPGLPDRRAGIASAQLWSPPRTARRKPHGGQRRMETGGSDGLLPQRAARRGSRPVMLAACRDPLSFRTPTSGGSGVACRRRRGSSRGKRTFNEPSNAWCMLNRHHIPYAIIGAMALNEFGYLRATVDVNVLLTPEGLATFKAHELGRAVSISTSC